MLNYQNISFPLGALDENSGLNWAKEEQSIREVIWNILLTRPGERLMRPEFGAGLDQFIHMPNNETTRRLIADVAEKAIKRWEPRITLLDVSVSTNVEQLNVLVLSVHYRLKVSGRQDSLALDLTLQS